MSRAAGIDEASLAEVADWRNSTRFTDRERLALELADAMTDTPADVADDLRARLQERFRPAELVELVSAIAWENHRARFHRALGFKAMGFSDGGFCVLPHRPPPPEPRAV